MSEQDRQLRSALLAYSGELRARHTVPLAGAVWLAAERRNLRLARERAARPLWIMQAVAAAVALVVCAWSARSAKWSGGWNPSGPWTLWGAAAVLLVAAGCWTMWRAARSLSV